MEKCVVSSDSCVQVKLVGDDFDALSGLIVLPSSAAYGFESNRSIGIVLTKSGSPRNCARSGNVGRIALAMRCRVFAEQNPPALMSCDSRMLRISWTAMPPELGGGIPMTS